MLCTASPRRVSVWSLCVSVLAAVVLGGCSDNVSDRDIEFVELPLVKAASEKPGSTKIIDARSPGEFAAGHIPGATNLQLPQVSDRKDSIDPALARYSLLVVYGNDPGSGVARAMVKRFIRSGAGDVKMFAGGLAEWTRAGLKVDRTAPPASAQTPNQSAPSGAVAR